ncbi:MAG: 50S ribosomal protein L22 [archaeon]
MKLKYCCQTKGAKAMGRDLQISPKRSYEVARMIRGKKLETAKRELELVVAKKMAVPHVRYKRKTGHKTGMMAGRYPVKTAAEFLKVLKNAESNAKDLNKDKLVVSHISVHKARIMYGRKKGSPYNKKTSHIQVVLTEA